MNKLVQLPAINRAARISPRRLPRIRRKRSRYFAFLSYSHQDEELAEWLHSQIESFRVPGALSGRLTENGVIPKRLTPIFRDQHELAAADDLGEEIEEALTNSQFLIVLCSPAAAKSRWTNAEIETFKRTRPDGCVLAAIAAGEPFATDVPGREAEECFPPALRHKFDRRGRPTGRRAEPLAADLRGEGESRRLGLLKLIAGMLGVGLDDLVQRETTRRQKRLAILAAASVAGMAITSTLAITAIQARDAAREQRREAEGLVSFMLGDLKDKLEPIGRLDALDGVGQRVLAYYSKQDTSELSDAALLQRSRALSLIAQVTYLRGNMDSASRLYREALAGTEEALRRNPDDPQRLYDQAQNIYWIGDIAGEQGDVQTAERSYREYKRLADRMVAIAPDNMKWRMEQEDAEADLGIVLYNQRRFAEAGAQFQQALQTIDALAIADPQNAETQKNLSLMLAWAADTRMSQGMLDEAIALRQRQVALLTKLAAQSPDVDYKQKLVPAEEGLGLLLYMRGASASGVEQLRNAVEHAGELIPIERNNTVWLQKQYSAQLVLADRELATGDQSGASAQTEAACATVRQLLTRDPNFPDWRAGLRDCELTRARVALASGANSAAVDAAQKALTAARTVKSNDVSTDRIALAKAYRVLGDAQKASGNSSAAATAWRQALAAYPPGVAERPLEMEEHVIILKRLGQGSTGAQLAARLQAMGYRPIS
jgi:tetratricopeptide (TPR) repeat protein